MKRCAIYTRKSSEEGLEQEFNSLDSQRESSEYYIKAQAHQEWSLVSASYDDGGYSGGTIERPALQRLLFDVERGLIDIIVVYKIDRLSRSMADFMKIMEVFDAHNVTFVSVTQHFDTNTSMGRLILNILQSFAQFEREMTTERIRDKVIASKRKGMWMGGVPPLGYDICDKKLIPNLEEKKIIEFVFDQFSQHQSATLLIKDLQEEGFKTKSWISEKGRKREGRIITKGLLYQILKNVVYIGQIRHKDMIYEGEHLPLIELKKFLQVQNILKENGKNAPVATDTPYLLKGLVFDSAGYAMTCAASKKKGRRYRYYTSTRAIKNTYSSSEIKPISGKILEDTIINLIMGFTKDSQFSDYFINEIKGRDEDNVKDKFLRTFEDFNMLWPDLSLTEQQFFIRLLIKKIIVFTDKLEITFQSHQLSEIVKRNCVKKGILNENLHTFEIPIKFKISNGRRYLVKANGKEILSAPLNCPEENIVQAIAKGFFLREKINNNKLITFSRLAKIEALDASNLAKYIRLTQLSPKIIESIIRNDFPQSLTLANLMKSFPNNWKQQEEHFGFSV